VRSSLSSEAHETIQGAKVAKEDGGGPGEAGEGGTESRKALAKTRGTKGHN
jgi:hypothetical protein